jgi:hypothetical protein
MRACFSLMEKLTERGSWRRPIWACTSSRTLDGQRAEPSSSPRSRHQKAQPDLALDLTCIVDMMLLEYLAPSGVAKKALDDGKMMCHQVRLR